MKEKEKIDVIEIARQNCRYAIEDLKAMSTLEEGYLEKSNEESWARGYYMGLRRNFVEYEYELNNPLFKQQIKELIIFWECEKEDRIEEGKDSIIYEEYEECQAIIDKLFSLLS